MIDYWLPPGDQNKHSRLIWVPFIFDHREINKKDDFVQRGQRRNLVRIGAPQSLFRIRRDYTLLDSSANERHGR